MHPLPAWVPGYGSGGIRWGLERTEALLAGVGNPHRRFRSLHIAGTNGKGSVAALCDAALRASGFHRVGLYTSPHLVSFTERIRIEGRPVADEALRDAAERLRPHIERTGASFFEATTVLALLCFAEAEVDVAVVEVGLGGRLDATNVITPVAAAITNIALDHAEYLGGTLPEIALEKAGILKPAVPAVTAESDPDLLRLLQARADELGTRLQSLDELTETLSLETAAEGVQVHFRSEAWGERTLHAPLRGRHQARNVLLAAELLAALPSDLRPAWDDVQQGFAAVRWPGRLQVEKLRGTTWLFDVAHNAAGAEALASSLELLELPRPMVLVMAVLGDKLWPAMLDTLLPKSNAAILTLAISAPPDRRWDLDLAAEHVVTATGKRPRVIPELGHALERAATLAPHGSVLVTGSFHTVGDAMQHLGISPF
ncbi:folylpolyglutamate synthase/dihydrofolate synthase family protein [soil metagenome]